MNIVIGNKRYSSWSLRAWLAVRIACGPTGFKEIFTPLAGAGGSPESVEEARTNIMRFSPTGKVPALFVEDLGITVYDSLAIGMFIADRYPEAGLLPTNPAARALCMSSAAEMHSGFAALRNHLPMNCCIVARKHGAAALLRDDVKADISRLCSLWAELREKYGISSHETSGPFLFGHFTLADCMYAPVALRFRSYDPDLASLTPVAREYVQTLCALPEVIEWIEAANAEPERIPQYEVTADDLTNP